MTITQHIRNSMTVSQNGTVVRFVTKRTICCDSLIVFIILTSFVFCIFGGLPFISANRGKWWNVLTSDHCSHLACANDMWMGRI